MAQSTSDQDEVISGINITPLVDIILVVLIIFIVTASFVMRNKIPLDLPQAKTGESGEAGLLNLALDAAGVLYINGRPGKVEQIKQAVTEEQNRLRTSGRPVSAFVSADVNARYGAFAQVVDELRLAGVTDIALDTRPPDLAQEGGGAPAAAGARP